MTFQEPTPDSLKAMAGWAISKKRDASDEQVLALGKFQNGCSELSECCPAPSHVSVSGTTVEKTPEKCITRTERAETVIASSRIEIVPESLVLARYGMVQPCNGVAHSFDIRNQRCKSCGISYIDSKGRKPELM